MDINKLVQGWMPTNEKLQPFYLGISNFVKSNIDRHRHTEDDNLTSKIIADPLLGYVNLTPLEVAIIDTGLFQRLRDIRQLGLANLVFPSLGYSRFEHSIGVLGRLNQLLNKLIENYNRKNSDADLTLVIKRYLDSIRLAALLHDIGHCLCSHCSERVINELQGTGDYPSAEEIRKIFSDFFGKDKLIPFAELFSVSIIGTIEFADYIAELDIYKKKEMFKVLENCCRFILGLPVKDEPQTVFLSQLMSCGLDVDKVDYMMREQHYTGIKLEIDFDRISNKLNVFDLKSFELPKNLEFLKMQFDAEKDFKVLGFSKGGQFVFEEFCIARLALNVKIYLHQKIRTAEGQLTTILKDLSNNATGYESKELQKAHNWLQIPESSIANPELISNFFKDEGLFASHSFVNEKQKKALKNIKNRDLYCRAFAFGQINSFSEAPILENKNLTDEIEDFFEKYDESDLQQKIFQKTKEIIESLGMSISPVDLENFIVDIPRLRFKSIQQGHESLYFERPPLSPLKWTIPLDKIVLYFEENRALGYVFAHKSIAPYLSLASEKVIFEVNNKVFSQEGNISKDTFCKMNEYKKTLTENGYYKKTPELKSISDYLNKADAAEKIKLIHEKLSRFSSLKNDRITINRITTFVNQFPMELQESCLTFLQHVEIYDESLLEVEICEVIKRYGNGKSMGIAHLGGVTDSGGRLSYNLRTLFEDNNLEVKPIDDNMIQDADMLIIYDDNINSGLQLLNIMAELLGELDNLPPEKNLNEKHIHSLITDDAKNKLKNITIHFCFIVGFEGTEEMIRNLLNEYLNFEKNNVFIHIHTQLKDSEKIFNGSNSKFNHSKKLELKECFTQIGEQLLRHEGKSPEKVESCKLGYAKAEAMVLFPYNVPTMTVTALWCKGVIDNDIPWIPLAERRRRTKDGKFIGED